MSNIDNIKRAVLENRMRNQGVITKDQFDDFKFEPKTIELELGEKIARGQNLEVFRPEGLEELYGRKNLCLKVFKNESFVWGLPIGVGRSPILESTMVQNLMAIRGLAPRIYDIVRIGGKTAQVSEFVTGDIGVVPIEDDRFHIDGIDPKQAVNFVGGKLVDWQGCIFNDFKGYRQSVYDKAVKRPESKGAGVGAYQSSKTFPGARDTQERLEKYNFKDMTGKTVLDIGCNYGMISRAVYDLGAKRVVGIDWPEVIEVTRELAILDGYFNLDFYGVDIKNITGEQLKDITGIEKFDIHLFLAMEAWVGWPEWVRNCGTLYYEGHGKNRPFRVEKFNQD